MTARTRDRLIGASLVVALVVATVPALVQLGWHLRLFAGRVGFPLDLEWMEGGMLVHAQRIAAGQGIYVKPSLEFIPYLYTPLYPALLALLSFVFPLGYLLGRVVSLLAFFAALVLLVALVVGEARSLARSRRLLAGAGRPGGSCGRDGGLFLYRRVLRSGALGQLVAGAGSAGLVAGLAR